MLVSGSRFQGVVQDVGLRVKGEGCRVQGVGLRMKGAGRRVQEYSSLLVSAGMTVEFSSGGIPGDTATKIGIPAGLAVLKSSIREG